MKTCLRLACAGLWALLVCGSGLWAYDNSPARRQVIPEAIWATATGGGTWVTQLQVTAKVSGTEIRATFYYGTTTGSSILLGTTTAAHQTLKFMNILATMSASYYGQVGALFISGQDDAHPLWAQAMTINGNYGKTYPGLGWTDSNTANLGRYMVVPNIQQGATYRTFIGCCNLTSGGYSMEVTFHLMSPDSYVSYGVFTKTFAAWEFMSFNPFVEAGLGTGYTNSNSWLLVWPTASGNSGADTRGLVVFGSTANNYTNDSYALIAIPFN